MTLNIKVAIVEDNGYYRMALAKVISKSKSLELTGVYASAEEALEKMPAHLPDVVLMDINLGKNDGIEAVRLLSHKCKKTHFLMCTADQHAESIYRALSAGANGYILKHSKPREVVDAIKEIYFGGSPMTASIARSIVNRLRTDQSSGKLDTCTDCLSSREKEILQLLNTGKLNKEIAADLGISNETVRKHVYHIYRKLGVNNRVEMFNKVNGFNLA